jgi:pyruvate dehydrogenase E2 component (dihydrolipoamide acetyltransferase)
LELNLRDIPATGAKGRLSLEDLQKYVKNRLKGGGNAGSSGSGLGFAFPPLPAVDFSKFGATEVQALSKIKKISGANLHRNWVSIPHITQFGEADVTDLEAFRQAQKDDAAKRGVRLTPLVFIMKAVVMALKAFPTFNASLDPSGESLILKKYFHVGVAVDTPNGLVVPVIRNVDQKGFYELAQELAVVSQRAREKGLSLTDMQGGCFSISSLGGIGGTAFTPIINAPEVAILGVSQTQLKPVYHRGQLEPRSMLPLSLSYDHRVIDGAEGARFLVCLADALSDIRRILL